MTTQIILLSFLLLKKMSWFCWLLFYARDINKISHLSFKTKGGSISTTSRHLLSRWQWQAGSRVTKEKKES
jgi:hypothetical protein